MLTPARTLALFVPAALLAGALGSQYWGGLVPCEMCMWQRWPHYAAVGVALLAVLLRGTPSLSRVLTILAALLIIVSGAIGVFHAGVEYGWWPGPAHCTTIPLGRGGDIMAQILATPLVRCDVAQWTLFHISLAGWNALFSFAGGGAVLALCLKRVR